MKREQIFLTALFKDMATLKKQFLVHNESATTPSVFGHSPCCLGVLSKELSVVVVVVVVGGVFQTPRRKSSDKEGLAAAEQQLHCF